MDNAVCDNWTRGNLVVAAGEPDPPCARKQRRTSAPIVTDADEMCFVACRFKSRSWQRLDRHARPARMHDPVCANAQGEERGGGAEPDTEQRSR